MWWRTALGILVMALNWATRPENIEKIRAFVKQTDNSLDDRLPDALELVAPLFNKSKGKS